MINRAIAALLFISALTGCARTFVVSPEFQSVEPQDRIHNEFKSKLQIVNNQPDNTVKFFSKYTLHNLTGNMYDWTAQAVDLTKQEIEKRGGEVASSSDKKLYLSFNAGTFEVGNWSGYRCNGELSVKTSTGYEMDYPVGNRTGGTIERACGGAITLSVIDLLNDEKIKDFLN